MIVGVEDSRDVVGCGSIVVGRSATDWDILGVPGVSVVEDRREEP